MIVCVGVGPGDPDLLTVKTRHLLERAEVVAGFPSVTRLVAPWIGGERVDLTYQNQVERLEEVASQHRQGKRCVVCFMGDVNFSGYQLLERVERAVGERVEIVPGVSSVQVVASRARIPLDAAVFVSFHKRGPLEADKHFLRGALQAGRHAIVLPRPWDFMPKDIAGYLVAEGILSKRKVTVFEGVCQQEREFQTTLGELKEDFSDMSILLIRAHEEEP